LTGEGKRTRIEIERLGSMEAKSTKLYKVQIDFRGEWVTFGKAENLEYVSAIAWKAECERNGDKARIVKMEG
jgi:hypothetical protein